MSEVLAAFLRARCDEDERVARAAGGASWAENGSGSVVSAALARGDYSPAGFWVASASWACEGEAEYLHEGHATHIARYDPRRVLAEVAVKRKLIGLADEASGLDDSVDLERRVSPRDPAAEPYLGEIMLRTMATAYADHPDFREEWRTA